MADPRSREGLRYSTPAITSYLDELHAGHDAALATAFAASELHGVPSIQLARPEARLLEIVTLLVRAERAVEIGALAGYSAIRLARGLAPGGRLWTLEIDPEHAAITRANLAAAGLADRVEVVEDDAALALPRLAAHAPFDLVFLDADKGRYDVYARWAIASLRPGGVLVADNVYFFGRLLDDDDDARAMRRFHEECAAALRTVCVSTPDGLLIGLKPS